MRLAFYAYYESFDFYRVGGTDSFLRRLTFSLIKIDENIKIEYILYGDKNKTSEINSNLKLVYIKDFNLSLDYIAKNNFNHIVNTWLLMDDRKFFHQFSKQIIITKFHNILFFYPDTRLKKLRKLYEFIRFKNNGKNFIVSGRQMDIYQPFCKNLTMLNPPVDEKYFTGISGKVPNKINITFLGRLDPRKGVDKVINIFQNLNPLGLFKLSIYGIHIPEDPESIEIYEWLKNQDSINFYEVEREKFTPEIDQLVVDVLHETDVFIQPYQNLDSTVDTPLLILEAMACNCAVISTRLSPILDIYKESDFLLSYDNFEKKAIELLRGITPEMVQSEKKRVSLEVKKMYKYYESKNVAQGFLNAIK